MISFEFHFEKWHEKTQKPLWLLGFPNRYLFRFAMLVAETGPDSPPSTSSVASLRACALLTPSGFVSPVRSALGSNCVGKKEDFIARPAGVLCSGATEPTVVGEGLLPHFLHRLRVIASRPSPSHGPLCGLTQAYTRRTFSLLWATPLEKTVINCFFCANPTSYARRA